MIAILEFGFTPELTIEDAVHELCDAFAAGKLPGSLVDDRYSNVRTLKKLRGKIPGSYARQAA